jgi:hypothetical protein
MTYPIDIVHDLQVFMRVWDIELKFFKMMVKHLDEKYKVTPYSIDDEYCYGFKMNGIAYGWDYTLEELYVDGDNSTSAITSGPAYEYALAYDKALTTAYRNVEKEMTYRGWIDEYCHNLFKDGWMTDLAYWSGGMDFDDAVGEIEYWEEL